MNKRPLCFVVIALIVSFCLCICGCGKKTENPTTDSAIDVPSESTEQPRPANTDVAFELADGLFITEAYAYTGLYVEDGKNEPCENVCAVRLYNGSDVMYQYLRFETEISGGSYTFSASTLLPGDTMTVLSENRDPFTAGPIDSGKILLNAEFAEAPSLFPETLRITPADGILSVKNISEAAVTNVCIYYKNTDAYGFFGGITYRVLFDSIAPGEILQVRASNLHLDSSVLVFADYEN